jgi:diaminohydroxyphosphoribosylaminopyrimidine deaminase/5-amino-6-(5-phosphoribosylamino)uracil reductase
LNARLWPGKNPVIIVLDPNNRIPKQAAIFSNGSKVIVLNSHKNEHTPLVQYIQIDFNKWPDEMNRVLLASSIQSILVEGGAKTLQTFIEHGIWDECYIFETPEVRNWNIHAPAISGNKQSRYPIGDDLLTLLKPES